MQSFKTASGKEGCAITVEVPDHRFEERKGFKTASGKEGCAITLGKSRASLHRRSKVSKPQAVRRAAQYGSRHETAQLTDEQSFKTASGKEGCAIISLGGDYRDD